MLYLVQIHIGSSDLHIVEVLCFCVRYIDALQTRFFLRSGARTVFSVSANMSEIYMCAIHMHNENCDDNNSLRLLQRLH